MLGRLAELVEPVVAGHPRGHLVEDPESRQRVTVRLRALARLRTLVPSTGGITDGLERSRCRCRRSVGCHPAPKRGGVADGHAGVVRDIAVDDALEVSLDLEAARTVRELPEPRQPGRQQFVDVVGQPDRGRS